MPPERWLCPAVLLIAGSALAASPLPEQQRALADAFLESCADGCPAAVLPLSSDERTEWSYFPWGHAGLALSDMGAEQRVAALALLDSGLSEDGRDRAAQVMALEIDEAKRGLVSRLWADGEGYSTVVFGTPGAAAPWSWRFEGHHLSVNMTHSRGEVVAGTPYFIGADPALVTEGELAGMRILEHEEVDARALFTGLDPAQRARALIRDKAPRDILTGSDARAELTCCEGIAHGELGEAQRGELLALVERVAGQLHPGVAALHLKRMRAAGVENLHFAWAGSAQPGEAHYYRIQGPTLLIEYANSQDDANHIHLVLRDPERDFGGEPLREHVAREH